MIDFLFILSFFFIGKCVLVIGVLFGIGLVCVSVFVEVGGDVVLVVWCIDKLEEVVSVMIVKGWMVLVLQFDVVDVLEVDVSVDCYGLFDVLVNSVGVVCYLLVIDIMLEDFDVVMNVNLCGVYFVIQVVVKGLIKVGKFGLFINMFFQMVYVGGIDWVVYCVLKFVVEGFIKVMVLEFGFW